MMTKRRKVTEKTSERRVWHVKAGNKREKERIDNDMKGDAVKKYWKRIMVGVTFLVIAWTALKPEYRVVFQLRSSGKTTKLWSVLW